MLAVHAALILLHFTFSEAGDSCPSKEVLAPCTCKYLPAMASDEKEPPPENTSTTLPIPHRRKRDSEGTLVDSDDGNSFLTIVDCKVPKSVQLLEETVSTALNRRLVDKLVVSNVPPPKEHTLARLPSGWLKHVRVRQFEVGSSSCSAEQVKSPKRKRMRSGAKVGGKRHIFVLHSEMSGDFLWYGDPFEGQEQSLLWIAANKCLLTGSLTYDTMGTVHTRGLHALPNVEGVDFSNNRLTTIMATSFRNPPTNLSTVILSRNSIQYIESGTFNRTPLLRLLDLSHNLLESLVRAVFSSPARHMENINLSWNSLTSLPADFFHNMPALKKVDLSHNFLYSLPDKPWASVWSQLKVVDVSSNFVRCDCNLLWLLSVLSSSEGNATTITPNPKALPGQTVLGDCSRIIDPSPVAVRYPLVALTRDRLNC